MSSTKTNNVVRPVTGSRRLAHGPLRASRIRPWLRKAESGSMEGGNFGDLLFTPYLIGLMLVGLIFALVGFWRVGASYATQRSAQIGAVSPEDGSAALNAFWQGWSNNSVPRGGFTVDEANKTVSANIDAQASFQYADFANWAFDIQSGGHMHIRSERFYGGGGVCDANGCDGE